MKKHKNQCGLFKKNVCVCERERERERECVCVREREKYMGRSIKINVVYLRKNVCECVCE